MDILRITLAICILAAGVAAQPDSETILTGRIVDSQTGLPIKGVSVYIEESRIGSVTDRHGHFRIDLGASGRHNVSFSCLGYEKTSITVGPGGKTETTDIIIPLDQSVLQLDGVSVTANRSAESNFSTASNVSVTTSNEFRTRTFSTTAEILREEPAVLVQKTTWGHGAPILRGLIGKYVLLLYDGIRLNRPTFRFGANQYLNTLDMSSLGSIEIVRGPSSVMYGSDAIGGAINLIPRSPHVSHERILIKPTFISRYSSADNGLGTSLNIFGNYHRLSSFSSLSYRNFDDLKAGKHVGRQVPTGWSEFDLSLHLMYHLNMDNLMTFDYLSVRQEAVPRYDKYVSGDFQKYIYDPQNRDLIAFTYRSLINRALINSFKINFSYSFEKEGRTQQKTGSVAAEESLDELTTLGSYGQISMMPVPGHTLKFGWEFYHDVIRSETIKKNGGITETLRPTYPDNSKYYSSGLFLQEEWHLDDRWELTAGIRYSYFDISTPLEEPYGNFEETYDDFTGMFSLRYLPVDYLSVFAKWARGFRAPNLNDLAVLKVSSSGVDVPSPGLNPENCDNFEMGAKINTHRAFAGLFLYYNRLNNLIDRVPGIYEGRTFFDENDNGIKDPDEFDAYQKANVGKGEIFGFEFDSKIHFADRFLWTLNCFWTRGNNITGHEPLSRIPPLMGLLGVRYSYHKSAWFEAFVRAAGAQRRLSLRDIDDTRIDPGGTPGWATFNFRMQYCYRNLELNLGIENLIDKTYKEHGSGVYSPGRNLVASVKYGL